MSVSDEFDSHMDVMIVDVSTTKLITFSTRILEPVSSDLSKQSTVAIGMRQLQPEKNAKFYLEIGSSVVGEKYLKKKISGTA